MNRSSKPEMQAKIMCKHCGERKQSFQLLKRHLWEKHGPKEACPVCGIFKTSCSTMYLMRKHLKEVHNSEPSSFQDYHSRTSKTVETGVTQQISKISSTVQSKDIQSSTVILKKGKQLSSKSADNQDSMDCCTPPKPPTPCDPFSTGDSSSALDSPQTDDFLSPKLHIGVTNGEVIISQSPPTIQRSCSPSAICALSENTQLPKLNLESVQ